MPTEIQALGQLAGGIAHDFNNVLQAVAGGAALIACRPGDAGRGRSAEPGLFARPPRGAPRSPRRMLVLARRGDLAAEPIDANLLLDDIREVFIHTLGPDIDIRVEVAPVAAAAC